MGQLVGVVAAQPELVRAHPEVEVPPLPLVEPVLEPLLGVVGVAEELELHLLELAGAEDEVARRDLVAKRLADLGDAERQLEPGGPPYVLEVDEDALGRLRTQVDDVLVGGDRPHVRLEHEVELARLGERGPLAARRALLRIVELVEPEPVVAVRALDERVGERGDVTRRHPHVGSLEDRRVDADDVVAQLHHRPPPLVLDVAEEGDAERPVVVGRAETAVDLGRLEDEAALLGEVDDGVEVDGHGVIASLVVGRRGADDRALRRHRRCAPLHSREILSRPRRSGGPAPGTRRCSRRGSRDRSPARAPG